MAVKPPAAYAGGLENKLHSRGTDRDYIQILVLLFLIPKLYDVTTRPNRLDETIRASGYSIGFAEEITK